MKNFITTPGHSRLSVRVKINLKRVFSAAAAARRFGPGRIKPVAYFLRRSYNILRPLENVPFRPNSADASLRAGVPGERDLSTGSNFGTKVKL